MSCPMDMNGPVAHLSREAGQADVRLLPQVASAHQNEKLDRPVLDPGGWHTWKISYNVSHWPEVGVRSVRPIHAVVAQAGTGMTKTDRVVRCSWVDNDVVVLPLDGVIRFILEQSWLTR